MLFASLAILMVLRFPIAYSLGISAVITATYMNIPYLNLFQKMTTGLSSFTFIAVPFFIMMAQVMCDGQITKKLMRMCNIFVGQIRGGTAIVNILVSMLFGGISGSSAADVSSIGAMLIPAMVDEGYDVDVIEFIDFAHSPKNLMLRCRRTGKRGAKKCAEARRLREQYGFEQTLLSLVEKDEK